MRVGNNGFSNGSIKLAHSPNGVGRNLTTIQGGSEDKRSNNRLLVLIFPAESAEAAGNGGAYGNAIIKRAPEQPGPSRDMCTKVPKVQNNLDASVNDRPDVRSKLGTSGATSREKIAFKESNLGSNGVEVKEGDVVASFKQNFMALPNGKDCNVVGECPGDAPRSGDCAGPGA